LVELVYTLTRDQVSELIEPLVLRCIHICRQVLKEKRLSPTDIEKLLLVGGPTYTPHLRELLSDSTVGLGIPLEFSIDPLTVVARGAAVFAGAQRRSEAAKPVFVPGVYNIELVHKPMGADTRPPITGKVVPPAQRSLSGFTIEFANPEARPPWRSGKIPVKPNGIFETTLWAEGGGQHSFSIELLDPTGRRCPVAPESITYTVALMISGAPLTHDIGVAMANNEVHVFFAKGTPLPSRKIRKIHKQVTQVRRNVATDAIRIPIVEGSYPKANRNRRIGKLEVPSSEIKRDLPADSDVEITVEIDESRQVHVEIYVPFLDQEFSHVCGSLRKPDPEIGELCEEAARVKTRLGDLREQTMQTAEPKAAELLIEIEDEKTITEIDRLLAACGDPDAANTCEARLLTLNAKLDEIEDCLEPATVRLRARQLVPWAEEIVRQHASEEDRRRFAMLRKELEVCMGGPLEDLRRKTDQIETLAYRVWSTHPSFWIGCFQYLEERREQMPDQQGAQLWFSHGRKAIANEDLEAVKSACRQLVDLLPPKEQEKARARGYGATTVKAEGT
jgi:molecular chaperone DnaK